MKMYSNESRGGKFPVAETAGLYDVVDCNAALPFPTVFPAEMKFTQNMPAPHSIYPEYWNDHNIALCPSAAKPGLWGDRRNVNGIMLEAANCSTDSASTANLDEDDNNIHYLKRGSASYTYYSYVLDASTMTDTLSDDIPAQLLVFQIERDEMSGGLDPEGHDDWDTRNYQRAQDRNIQWLPADHAGLGNNGLLGNANGFIIRQFREGIERFMITDIDNPSATALAQSSIAVMWDRVSSKASEFNHVPGGTNVLFMDGHTQFQKYPSNDFPANKGLAALVGQDDSRMAE
jgi:prepilin-type processing-associated H-X9-DG protein